MSTLIVGLAVALLVSAALWKIIADRKAGKGSCGGDCSKCKGCH